MIRKLTAIATLVLMGLCASHAATLNSLHAFCLDKHCHDGSNPWGGLLRDPSTGALYGTTFQGGNRHKGTIYALLPTSARELRFQKLYDFCAKRDCSTGESPVARLIADSAGNLYGTAVFGGNSSSRGTVFELIHNADKTSWDIKILHAFCPAGGANCPDGGDPTTSLTYAGKAGGLPYDGSSPLYGTTENGGTNINAGTVYKLVPDGQGGWQESVLYNFCSVGNCTDGANPLGDLTMDSNGNLFGTAHGGGTRQQGTVYEITGVTRGRAVTMTTLYNFCQGSSCQDGAQPSSGVTLDGEGNLYGTTTFGGLRSNNGIAYKIVPSGAASQLQVLHAFCSEQRFCQDGSEPAGNLAIDASGNLYGTATQGSKKTFPLGGTAFQLTPGSGGTYTFSTLYKFCHERRCADGSGPASGIVMDNAGNLYGTTQDGGKRRHNTGTVFELTLD